MLLRDVYGSPCTAALRPQAFDSSSRVSLAGSSNPALCRGLVQGLFNFSACPFSRCSFNGIFQPPVAGDFLVSPGDTEGGRRLATPGVWAQCGRTLPAQAFSAFFYTVDFLSSVMGLPVATLQQLEAAVVTVCNQTWSEVRPVPLLQGLRGGFNQPPSFPGIHCMKSGGPRPLRGPRAVGDTPLVGPGKWLGGSRAARSQKRWGC